MAAIRIHVQQQKALGDSRFQASIEALLARRVDVRPRGRPKRPAPNPEEPELVHASLLE